MDLDDLAPKLHHPNWTAKRSPKGRNGALAAAANGQAQGGKVSAAKARARRIPITLPAISIQKRDEA
jgi:hypothetical protein